MSNYIFSNPKGHKLTLRWRKLEKDTRPDEFIQLNIVQQDIRRTDEDSESIELWRSDINHVKLTSTSEPATHVSLDDWMQLFVWGTEEYDNEVDHWFSMRYKFLDRLGKTLLEYNQRYNHNTLTLEDVLWQVPN
jgi:hypothetical protein